MEVRDWNPDVATVSLLTEAMTAKDAYTQVHCERVALYALETSRRLGLSEHDTRIACYSALLHDVGKIGVCDLVLNKPGPLLDNEWSLVREHPRLGHDLLMAHPALHECARPVLHHHEWFDGTGYPDGLSGTEIPIASRIVAAIDAYCAMIDTRCYKAASSPADARAELVRCAGTQFDPHVVVAVLAAINHIDYGVDVAKNYRPPDPGVWRTALLFGAPS